MGRRLEIVGTGVLSLLLFGAQPVFADPTPTPSPSSTSDISKSPQEKYKIEKQDFMQAMRERDLKMRIINLVFKNSVEKAYADARKAMSSAITLEQKNVVATNRRNAIALAISVRDASITGLGPLPTPPAKPEKNAFEKFEPKMEGKSKGKR